MFLSDSELVALLESNAPPITGFDLGQGDARFAEKAPVQPCSVDLSIGEIYVPGAASGKPGSEGSPSCGLVLEAGMTAVIVTEEKCDFPADIGAIGFPPNSVSSQGILMTNPGHVDPGYEGSMSFTVINMGDEPYALLKGDKIVTLLLFRLSKKAHSDLAQRRGGNGADPGVGDLLGVLSPDFLNVTERIKTVASAEELRTRRTSIWAPIAIGLFGLMATLAASLLFFNGDMRGDIRELRGRTTTLGDVQDLETRVQVLERRLERAAAASRSAQVTDQ